MINTKIRLFVILGVFIIVLGVIFGFCWWLTTSLQIANTPLSIKAKYYCYFNLAPKFGITLINIPFEIIPMQEVKTPDGIVYAYIMLGRYENIDFDNQILYLRTKSNKIYGYKYSPSKDIPILYKDIKAGENITGKIGISPFSKGEILSIQWGDKRILTKVLSEAESNPFHLINLNMKPDEFQLINKVQR